MNRFQDGFSNNSYDDLLNEYAGESLPSKPVKKPEPAEQTKSPIQSRYKKIDDDIPSSSPRSSSFNSKSGSESFDIDLLKAFEEPVRKKTDDNIRHTSTDLSREEERRTQQNRNKFTVNIDYAKTFAIGVANKVKTVAANAKSHANANKAEEDDPFISSTDYPSAEKEDKTKFDFNNFAGSVINIVQANKREFMIFGCCLIVSIVLACCAISCVNDVLAINRDGEETIEVVLPNDADTSDAIRVLDKAGLIKNSIFCNVFAKLMGVKDDNYLPGIYYFTDDMGIEKMLNRFKTSSTRGALISITIPEGYTVDQIFQRLEKNNICTAESLYRVLETVDFGNEYDFIAKIDNPDDRYCILEGYMFPATYEFEQGTEPASVIRKFLDAFKSRWSEEFAAKATELGMSMDEIITIASIVEKEGNGKGQFLQISSVLHNRLNRSGLYPTLDCNSTKDYVKNTVSKRANPSELNKFVVSYNTYEVPGLTPSAICNPGLDAIEAALYPTPTKYYFFRHDKNNKIYMAETIEEHNANGRTVEKVNAGK